MSYKKSKNKDVPVIIITGHANIEMAVSSLKHGAFEFVENLFIKLIVKFYYSSCWKFKFKKSK